MIKPAKLQRPRLIKMIESLSNNRLIYIHAPAGYGKTTCAQLWIEHMEKKNTKATTVTLDELDNKTAGFFGRFARSLLNLQPDNNRMSEFLLSASFNTAPDECVIAALGEFEINSTEHVVVFDDLHVIDNKQIIRLLPILCKRMPSNITLLFLSRNSPPDVFAEFISKGIMGIMEAEHLRFNAGEIKGLFNNSKRPITSNQADTMLASTGGWAIGLSSILLSGGNVYDTNFTTHYLEVFFKTNLWDKWDEQLKTFLMNVSVAEEFTPQLANALTGGKTGEYFVQRLMSENIFLRNVAPDTYALHDLFRDFLLKMLVAEQGEKAKNKQMQKVGDWFYKQKDYYRAVAYYLKSGYTEGISKGLSFMYNFNSPYASIEDTLAIIHMSVSESLIKKTPFLIETLAWAAWIEGRNTDLSNYLDTYFKKLPKIILQNPTSATTALVMRIMDTRIDFIDITKLLKKFPLRLFTGVNSPSISQNMPLAHRCSRDFSEYILHKEDGFSLLRQTLGLLMKDEYDAAEFAIRAGLYYECGNLDKALELAFLAKRNMHSDFAPEVQFCVLMILSSVLYAQGDENGAQKIIASINEMIERHKAYYLFANFRAYQYRLALSNGDKVAAEKWISQYATPLNGVLPFYKIYQSFITARAYIVMADYNTAILILNDILKLSCDYRRPLCMIESYILLAIAYWKKAGAGQAVAIDFFEQAIEIAYKYGYVQPFINESPDIETILSKIQKRAVQSEMLCVPASFIKSIYLIVLPNSKTRRGLTGGRLAESLTFTDKQKTVMRLVCEGHSQGEIAEIMYTSANNVKSHVKLIYKKLDVSNASDAIMRIKEIGALNDK